MVRFLADTGGGNIFVSGDLTQFVSALAVLCEGLLFRWAVASPSLIL